MIGLCFEHCSSRTRSCLTLTGDKESLLGLLVRVGINRYNEIYTKVSSSARFRFLDSFEIHTYYLDFTIIKCNILVNNCFEIVSFMKQCSNECFFNDIMKIIIISRDIGIDC
jgi:hypothetical protein